MSSTKYIALIDCDSFFCSCERKLNPELNNKPLSVVSSERGCVIARSREAKAIGILICAFSTASIIASGNEIKAIIIEVIAKKLNLSLKTEIMQKTIKEIKDKNKIRAHLGTIIFAPQIGQLVFSLSLKS